LDWDCVVFLGYVKRASMWEWRTCHSRFFECREQVSGVDAGVDR
jgi:hypothetical protein